MESFETGQATAVLCSGGLDSAVLLVEEARLGRVHPVYVMAGLAWEASEIKLLRQLLTHLSNNANVRPLALLDVNMRDVYPHRHWAITGEPPGYDTPDEDVYLPGRNIVLLSKASVFCALNGIHRVALGPLAGNPFPDATPEFFAAIARALSLGLDHAIEIVTPLATLHKADVVRRGAELGVRFELTMSCMNPGEGLHCGRCSKCRERQHAFAEAGLKDPAEYAQQAAEKRGLK